MGGKVYSEDGKMKLCKGALHRKGVFLPIHHFAILNKGRRAGKPQSECRDCWRLRQGTGYTVSVEAILPIIDRLVTELGTQHEVSRRLGLPLNTISITRKYKRVRGTFVEKLKALDSEIQKEKMQQWQNNMEPDVVMAEPLGQILRDYCRDWFKERPVETHDFMGPQDFMHQKANELSLRITGEPAMSLRQVGRICNSEKDFVGLSQADALLTAIGKSEMLYTGEIKVILNPRWSLEAYMSYMKDRGCV